MNQLINSKYYFFVAIMFFISTLDAQQNNREFRATWVITWEHISAESSVEQNKARVREILDNHKKANMTSVLFQVRQGGTAYYNSSYEPWGSYAGSTDPGYDPLAYAIEEAHKRGLELHTWFNVFNVSSTDAGTISDKHPEWICRDENGNPMTAYRAASPGLAEVRDYTIDVAMEIVRNYDIDGLHLDYIRWNEFDTDDMIAPPSPLEQASRLDGDFHKQKIKKIASTNSTNRFLYDINHPYSSGVPSGYSSWEDWWRWSVTEFVKTLHDSIQTVKPWVRLSPAALGKYKEGGVGGWNGYYVVYQDAALWFNEGYVDQLTPMHYNWYTGSSMLDAIRSDWEPNIQQGINEGRLYSVGPYSSELGNLSVWSNHVGIVKNLRLESWVDGYQFFSYGSWKGYNYWDDAAELFFENKVKVRSVNSSAKPDPPSLALYEIDSLNYEITVTPDAGVIQNQWYAIYRSEDDNIDINSDQIINVHFGNLTYTVKENFSGIQNYNGTYTYFATALNRYWSESDVSNSATTNLIPSFAPQIVSTYPVAYDTIKVNEDVVIEFSKSMKVTSFYYYLSFEPSVQITSLLWSNDNKELKVGTENLAYNTNYTFTISSEAVDYNDVNIDGNGDGVAGDSFTLNFSTNDVDLLPPQVVKNYPNDNDENVDVASIIQIEFDEIINEQILTDEIELLNDSKLVELSYIHSETDNGKSVLSIQPNSLLEISTTYTLSLGASIEDTLGNSMAENFNLSFTTSGFLYDEITMVEDFTNPGDWREPSYSGSTTGIFVSGTSFIYTDKISLPVPSIKRAGKLSYLWDGNASEFLIREYLAGGIPQSIYFDTSYVLQSYVFGDGSNNMVRFAIDESEDGINWGGGRDHEVSKWITIDWNGWKLIEWQLNDPNSIGTWISPNETLTGPYCRIDSYQLTKSQEGTLSGEVYFEDLRAVKKDFITTNVVEINENIPDKFVLFQNYPNPFNPSTTIEFSLPKSGFVTLKIYNVQGEEVLTLVKENLLAGNYSKSFNANGISSGIYFYTLSSANIRITNKMILLK